MKPALNYNWTESLSQWQQILTGEELKHIQNEIISRRLKISFGHHLIKLGHLSCALDTTSCLINHQVNVLATHSTPSQAGLVAEFDQLSMLTNSVDLVLMNHELEFASDPHQVLREVHRVLMPNGNLVLSVFNPFSFFILNKLWPFKSSSPLWHARLFSVGRIKDWLTLLGFEIVEQEYCAYSAFLSAKPNNLWLQRMMQKYLSKLGSVCIITARKREWPLTPIRKKVRFKSSFRPAVSRASSNSVKVKNN